MRPFAYYAPRSLEEAIAVLCQQGEGGRPLAGGTDLLVQMKEGWGVAPYPVYIVSLRGIPELKGLAREGPEARAGWAKGDARRLRIGATVTMAELETSPLITQRFPILAQAAGRIGSVQVRDMATIGGNLCNASPSADLAPPLLALDAQAQIAGTGGERTLPLKKLFLGPGKTALEPGELLAGILVPLLPPHSGASYLSHTPGKETGIAVAGVAVRVTLEAGRAIPLRGNPGPGGTGKKGAISEARVALGAAAPTPMRARGAEAALVGQMPSEELFQRAAQIAAAEAQPIGDVRGSAAFRRELVRVLAVRCLRQAVAAAREG